MVRVPGRVDRVVASLAVTTTAAYGVLFYAYGVLLVPMQDDLGWSRSFLSAAFSGGLLVAALLAIPVGRWLDHRSPRPLLLAGSMVAVALLAGWANARSKPFYAAVWLLLGACQAILFYEPAFTVLAKRFHGAERTRAITTVTLLAGLASTIFGPLTAKLEQLFGWRETVAVLAAILGVVTLPAFWFGFARRAVPAPATSSPDSVPPSTLPRDALRTRTFWLLTLAYLLSAVTTFGVAVHIVAFLHGRGMATGRAATALGAIGLVQVLGRTTFVRATARHASVSVATWILALKGVGLAVLVVAPGAIGLVAFVVVYGASNGISTLTRATTIAEIYGHEHYGSISAVIAAVSAVAGAMTPFCVAVVSDAIGSEAPVLGGLAVLSLLAAVSNEAVARPARRAANIDAVPLTLDL